MNSGIVKSRIHDPQKTLGNLFLHIGNVSPDILKSAADMDVKPIGRAFYDGSKSQAQHHLFITHPKRLLKSP